MGPLEDPFVKFSSKVPTMLLFCLSEIILLFQPSPKESVIVIVRIVSELVEHPCIGQKALKIVPAENVLPLNL